MIKHELFKGGFGDDLCAGCAKVWVLPPDINWETVDPIGPQRKLKTSGTNVFKESQRPATISVSDPFTNPVEGGPADTDNLASDWLVVTYESIGQTATYSVGCEKIGTTIVKTPCVAIVGNLVWPGGPFRRPAVSVLDGSGMAVTLTVGEEIASSMWEASADIRGSRRQYKPETLFQVTWNQELWGSSYYGVTDCWPAETGPLASIYRIGSFWDFEPNFWGFRDKRSAGFLYSSQMGTAKNGRVRLGCDFMSLLSYGTATAITPTNWSPTGDSPGFNLGGYAARASVEDLAFAKTSNGCETTSRQYGTQKTIDIYHNWFAKLEGTSSGVVEWRPWAHASLAQYSGTAIKPDYGGYGGFGVIITTVGVFCSPESQRGIANAFGTFVTFDHDGEELPTDTHDFGYRAEFAIGTGTTVNATNVDYTESKAISERDDWYKSGALKAYVIPRVIESTAPPVLPSKSSDVIDAEQCMHIDWNGPTDSPREFGGYYRDAACDCAVTATANLEEPAEYHSPATASPQINLMTERQRTFTGCVRFTGAHRHFTLPMANSGDVSSVKVKIEIAADEKHLQFAKDCPGYRGTLFDQSQPLKSDGSYFMPGAYTSFAYVMNSMVCGDFVLSKNRPDGKWLGANRFCYRGEASGEEIVVKASNRRQAYKAWDRSTGGTMPVPYAAPIVAARSCINVNTNPCDGINLGVEDGTPDVVDDHNPPEPYDGNMSEDCKKFIKAILGAPFCKVMGLKRHYYYPLPGFYGPGWDYIGPEFVNVPLYDKGGPAEGSVEPDLCYVLFGTDWKAVSEKASINIVFEGSQNEKPPGVNSDAELFFGDFQYQGIPRQNKYKPRLNFTIRVNVRAKAWCSNQYFDKYAMIWKGEGIKMGNKIGGQSYDEQIAQSTFGWTMPITIALTQAETAAFYNREKIELYVFNSDYRGSYAQCTKEQAPSMESLKITVQAE